MCGKGGKLIQPSNQASGEDMAFQVPWKGQQWHPRGFWEQQEQKEKPRHHENLPEWESLWSQARPLHPLPAPQDLADHVTAQGHGVSSQAQCSTAMLRAANAQPDVRGPRAALSYLLPRRQTPACVTRVWTTPSSLLVHQQWEDMSILTTGYCYISTEEKKIQRLPPVCFAVTLNPCWNFSSHKNQYLWSASGINLRRRHFQSKHHC